MNTRLSSLLIILISSMIFLPGAADAAWPVDGAPVCELPEMQQQPKLISDGAGGMIVAWADDRDGNGFILYAQRLDGSGDAYWTFNGMPVGYMGGPDLIVADVVPDAGHGAIIVWFFWGGSDIYAHRVDETGALPWGSSGVWISSAGQPNNVVAAPDGAGGVVLAWDSNNGPFYDVFAQRIDAGGNEVWTPGGVLMFDPITLVDETDPCIIAGGSGGAFVAATSGNDMRCQRIYPSGTLWDTRGISLRIGGSITPEYPAIADDGFGGAYVAWQEHVSGYYNLYAHRINGSGVTQWTSSQTVCAAYEDQKYPDVINDGFGNAVVCWQDRRMSDFDIYAQKIDPTGTMLWIADGKPICAASQDQTRPRLLDGPGSNLLVAYCDTRGNDHIGAQVFDIAGGTVWATDGVEVLPGELNFGDYDVASDGMGGVVATVMEDRNAEMGDIYAQAVNSLGVVYSAEPRIVSIADVPGDQGGWVQITIGRSDRDDLAIDENPTSRYDVWREIPPQAAPPELAGALSSRIQAAPGGVTVLDQDGRRFIVAAPGAIIPSGWWERIGSFAATQDFEYFYLAPTDGDSSKAVVPYSAYFVSAHTTDPDVWFTGVPDSGYSIDNIAPHVPTGFAVAYNTGSGNQLTWDECPDEDFKYFRVYRDEIPGYSPSPSHYVYYTIETQWLDTVADGWKYTYEISAVDMADNVSGSVEAIATGVEGSVLPKRVTLFQNTPNPFNPSTSIRFGVPSERRVKLSIYGVNGDLIHTLLDESVPAGFKSITWNGLDDTGNRVGSGVYFYRLETSGETVTKKMILLK